MRRIIHTLVIVVALATVGCVQRRANIVTSKLPAASPTPKTVQTLISSLSSPAESTRSAEELIDLGRRSATQRDVIIHQLIQSAESQDDLRTGQCFVLKNFDYWESATKVFAQLRAIEAIDLLITTIACGNGWSGSLAQEPSLWALVDLGTVAVPKLSKALKRERDGYVRLHLRRCLDRIQWDKRHPP